MQNHLFLQGFFLTLDLTNTMKSLSELPNIGKELAKKLELVGITSEDQLKQIGSKDALARLSTLENSGACINMLYALEGAIQGIRWHSLTKDDKLDLLEFFRSMKL